MIRCEETLEEMALALSGEPGGGRSPEVEEHLRGCASCAAEGARLGGVLDALRREQPPDPGPHYWRTFGIRLRTRIAGDRVRSRMRAFAAVAAAAVIMASGGLVGYRLSFRPSPPTGGGGMEVPSAEDQADARLGTLLERAAADARGQRDLERILDELTPASPLELEEAIAPLPQPEGEAPGGELPGT